MRVNDTHSVSRPKPNKTNPVIYSRSRKPDLPVTHSSHLVLCLAYYSFFSSLLKIHCWGRVIGFVGDGGNISVAAAIPS